jgi:2-haloacid dehalogenase
VDVLKMAAARHEIELGRSLVNELRERMQSLPAFPEVKGALRCMPAAGYRIAALSNSGSNALKQLRHAGIADYFERTVSVSEVKQYKPAPQPYRAVAQRLGVRTSDMLMASAHPWDLLGASGAGCRTALIRRSGAAPLPGAPAPDLIADDLEDLAAKIPGLWNTTYRVAGIPFAAAGVLAGAISAAVLLRRARKRS